MSSNPSRFARRRRLRPTCEMQHLASSTPESTIAALGGSTIIAATTSGRASAVPPVVGAKTGSCRFRGRRSKLHAEVCEFAENLDRSGRAHGRGRGSCRSPARRTSWTSWQLPPRAGDAARASHARSGAPKSWSPSASPGQSGPWAVTRHPRFWPRSSVTCAGQQPRPVSLSSAAACQRRRGPDAPSRSRPPSPPRVGGVRWHPFPFALTALGSDSCPWTRLFSALTSGS